MDATAVCAVRALCRTARRERYLLPIVFGAFQVGMAALGWLGGSAARVYIESWDHWVASGLLALVGGHMIVEGIRGGDDACAPRDGSLLLYLGLALATSIDAAAAGLTLTMLSVTPGTALALIGLVTVACCAVGYAIGRALGERVGPRLGIVGGLILVGIALDIAIRAP